MVNFLLHGWMNSVEREELWLLLSQLLLVLIKICVFCPVFQKKGNGERQRVSITRRLHWWQEKRIRAVDTSKNKTNSTYWVES